MTLTFIDIYNECAGQPWSMFDNDTESVEDFESAMRISINKAASFLWNLKPWSFRISSKKITTKENKASYTPPDGMLLKRVIDGKTTYGIKYGKKFLTYNPNYEIEDEEFGEPKSFYVEDDVIYISPTPDNTYTLELKYLRLPFALDEEGNDLYELKEDNDYINIKEKYEVLFKNCLISKAMLYAIADENDENYSGYLEQYNDALSTMLDYCKTGIVNKNIVW